MPTDNGLWELPAKPQEISEREVKVRNINPEKEGTSFKRKIVKTMELPCSTAMAFYRQRLIDEKQKVA